MDSFPKIPSDLHMEQFRAYQNEVFADLADECETCGHLYVDDYPVPKGCPCCGRKAGD